MRRLPWIVLVLAACDEGRTVPPPSNTGGRDATATSSSADAAALADASPGDDAATPLDATAGDAGSGGLAGLGLLTRMAGLWSGAATGTLLGSFPRMIFDFRASDARTLFGRVDLDGQNALRMAFYVQAGDRLVFRNGGLFMGLSRDTLTELVEVDEARGHYRFCELTMGCDYNEATIDFASPTSMTMDVTVRRQPHLHWVATRLEERSLPSPFPAAGGVPVGAPFPPMGSVRATIRWTAPLPAPADAWILLSVNDCSVGSCVVSRAFSAHAQAGATSAELLLDQVHAGPYKALGFLDRDRNVGSTLAPSTGDGVTLPNQALTVGGSGEATWSGTIVLDL